MIRRRRGVVTALGDERPGAQDLIVDIGGELADAVAYPELTGPMDVGDTVIVNTTAVALGLGTGGFHIVMAVEGRESGDDTTGRVMKGRYSPWQTSIRAVEETHRDVLGAATGLANTPVVVCPLHSMIGPVAAGAKRAGEGATVVYVMTDGAAIPGAMSRLVPRLRSSGLLDAWISCGQAFGGELEAVTIWTALLGAVHVLGAEVVVVADGPGNLGTDTTWGVSALAGGNTLNAVHQLGGRPIHALRVSFVDQRDRHLGISHHSLTILRDVVLVDVNVPVPALRDAQQRDSVWRILREQSLEERHHVVEVDGRPGVEELAARGVEVTTMGRGVIDDPAFFEAAGAAGVLAGRMAAENRRWRTAAGERDGR